MEKTIDNIRLLASQKRLRANLRAKETFYISENDKAEVEGLLKNEKVGYAALPFSFGLLMFIIQD